MPPPHPSLSLSSISTSAVAFIVHIFHIYIASIIYNFATASSQFKNFSAIFTPEKVTSKMLKSVEKGSQTGGGIRPQKSPKSQKIRDTFKMGPQASKMSPRASKITQNHENLVTPNRENPRKQT